MGRSNDRRGSKGGWQLCQGMDKGEPRCVDGSSGSSGAVRGLGLQKSYALQYGPVLCGADSGMCATVALVLAIDAVRGRSVAVHYCNILRKLRPSIDKLAGMSEVSWQMDKQVPLPLYVWVELRKVKKGVRLEFEMAPYNWITNQKNAMLCILAFRKTLITVFA